MVTDINMQLENSKREICKLKLEVITKKIKFWFSIIFYFISNFKVVKIKNEADDCTETDEKDDFVLKYEMDTLNKSIEQLLRFEYKSNVFERANF